MTSNQLLFKLALKSPILVVLTALSSFSGAVLNGIGTALIVPLLLGFLSEKPVGLPGAPPILQKVISLFDGFSEEYKLIAMTVAVLLAIILKNGANYATAIVSSLLSRTLVSSMRLDGVRLLLEVDLDFYAKMKIGDLMNRLNTEIGRTATAIRAAVQMSAEVITVFVFISILIAISWQLTLVSTFFLAIVFWSNQIFVKRSKDYGQNLTDKAKELTNKLIEILTGIRLIKTVANEKLEAQKVSQLIREHETAELQSQSNYAAIDPINEISGILAILLIVACGRFFFPEKLESLSAILLTYLVVLFRLLPFVGKLNSSRSRFANSVPSVQVVSEFLSRKNKPMMVNGTLAYHHLQDGIKFDRVSFAYPSSDSLALDNVDLWIPKGKTTALVGTSGAGKSTLADLLPRFYDPTNGSITVDGKDLRDYDTHTVRQAMGVVSQDTFLFNNSVRYNLMYGCEQASDAELIEAAKRANAYEFIMNLPQGFETEVGDRGVMLSGGQRQRLAIARALLRNPDILILDEATSALDTVSERLVQEAIDELCRNRTTVVIAHRLSTIQNADQIAVLHKGQVVEVGTHEDLLQKENYYARLYETYFQERQHAIEQARNETLINTSYEIRTRLNPMIGSLNLLVDNLIESPEERQESVQEAYDAAVRLLKTLQFIEDSAKSG
jgi:ATP-binding cassette, subfamily B, bacterial MsbA